MSTINKAAAQVTATVISNKRIGAYHQIILSVGDVVRHARPGNFIAIQVGGIGELAPERRTDLAKLGVKALICGTLASYLSATIAGILY